MRTFLCPSRRATDARRRWQSRQPCIYVQYLVSMEVKRAQLHPSTDLSGVRVVRLTEKHHQQRLHLIGCRIMILFSSPERIAATEQRLPTFLPPSIIVTIHRPHCRLSFSHPIFPHPPSILTQRPISALASKQVYPAFTHLYSM